MGHLAAVFFLAFSALAAPAGTSPLGDLAEGRHRLIVSGMLCKVCERAVIEEFKTLPEVSAAEADFDRGEVALTVKKGRLLKAALIKKTLNRAAKHINLGNRLQIQGVLSPSAAP